MVNKMLGWTFARGSGTAWSPLAGNRSRESRDDILAIFVPAVAHLYHHLGKLSLPTDEVKTYLLSSDLHLAKQAVKALPTKVGLQAAVRKLGYQYSLDFTRKPKILVQHLRIKKALKRAKRMSQVVRRKRHPNAFRAGIQNEALYGSEVAVLLANLIAGLRSAAAAAGCWLGRGLPVPLRMLAIRVALDPGFDHYYRTIETWAREIWTYFHGKDNRPSDLLNPKEWVKLHLLRGASAPQGTPHIPAAIQHATTQMGWTWLSATQFQSASHGILDLSAGSPAMLKRIMKKEWTITVENTLSALDPDFAGWASTLLTRLLASTGKHKLDFGAQKSLVTYMANKIPTASRYAQWGY